MPFFADQSQDPKPHILGESTHMAMGYSWGVFFHRVKSHGTINIQAHWRSLWVLAVTGGSIRVQKTSQYSLMISFAMCSGSFSWMACFNQWWPTWGQRHQVKMRSESVWLLCLIYHIHTITWFQTKVGPGRQADRRTHGRLARDERQTGGCPSLRRPPWAHPSILKFLRQ